MLIAAKMMTPTTEIEVGAEKLPMTKGQPANSRTRCTMAIAAKMTPEMRKNPLVFITVTQFGELRTLYAKIAFSGIQAAPGDGKCHFRIRYLCRVPTFDP